MSRLFRYLLTVAILVLSAGREAAQERVKTLENCLPAYFDMDTLKALAAAKDLGSLDSAHRRAPFTDAAIEVVYAAKRLRLGPGSATDEALLRALPRNPLEFWFVYALTTPEKGLPTDISDLVYEYYSGAAAAVARTGKHYLEYLRLSEMALSGEMLDMLHDHNEDLFRTNSKRFRSAIRLLSERGRDAACGEDIPCFHPSKH